MRNNDVYYMQYKCNSDDIKEVVLLCSSCIKALGFGLEIARNLNLERFVLDCNHTSQQYIEVK